MRLTAKQAVALVGGLVTLVSFARVVVLFLEALSAVRIERAADVELLEAREIADVLRDGARHLVLLEVELLEVDEAAVLAGSAASVASLATDAATKSARSAAHVTPLKRLRP